METDDVVSLNKRAWERVADRYNRRRDFRVGVLFEAFTEALPIGARVLDVGSGTGLPYSKLLAEQGYDVVGVDVSPKMVELARTNVPEATFLEASMTEMEFDGEFDGVLSVFSMLLLDPPRFREAAARIHRSLKRGGVIYVVLNEHWGEGSDADAEAYVEIMGEVMYSRGYTVGEVRGAFHPMGVEEVGFQRDVHKSEEFGEEHVIEFLFEKP
jgi:SAM-dependent methyltransferase